MEKSANKKRQAYLLIFLCWLAYTVSYFGKVNYAANITQIIDFYGITKAQAGSVSTFFFFAYGIGQVVNGVMCRKYNMKWMIFISLTVSASINFLVAVSDNFEMIKWLWMINGFVMSILWPTLIRLLSETLPQEALSLSSVAMGTTVAIGTLTIYGLSALYVAFDKFKLAFYTAAFAVALVAVIWLIIYKKAVSIAKDEENTNKIKPSVVNDKKETSSKEKKIIIATICVLCFYAIGVNLMKDGLTTWVPAILKEEFAVNDSLSILLTLFLPVLAIFGNAFALNIHKKIPDYINHCVTVFAVVTVLLGIIIGSLTLKIVVFMLLGLIAVNFLASSLNSLITSIFPLFMRGKVNSGLFAGVLNGFCYVGSALSSYGLGAVADNFGWTAVFYTLGSFCIITFIVWIGYHFYKKNSIG